MKAAGMGLLMLLLLLIEAVLEVRHHLLRSCARGELRVRGLRCAWVGQGMAVCCASAWVLWFSCGLCIFFVIILGWRHVSFVKLVVKCKLGDLR